MAATHVNGVIIGGMQVFQANRAILRHLNAHMIVFSLYRHTTFTSITMETFLAQPNSAAAALITMKDLLPFLLVIKQIAYTAKVLSKIFLTVKTSLTRLLDILASHTLYLIALISI